jgi:hypothetical protein
MDPIGIMVAHNTVMTHRVVLAPSRRRVIFSMSGTHVDALACLPRVAQRPVAMKKDRNVVLLSLSDF